MFKQRYTVNSAHPIVRALLGSGLSIAEIRAASPLSENAQRVVDEAVLRVALERLVVADDVMAEGLVTNIDDPLSVLEYSWELEAEHGGAQRSMIPGARGQNSQTDKIMGSVPLYITSDEFSVGIRQLRAAARIGTPIDVSAVQQKTRRVNESIEDAFINGSGTVVAGKEAYGLLNHPDRNSFVYGDSGRAWTHASKTGEDIVDDVLGMLDKQDAANQFGPVNLYIPTLYGNVLNRDFKSATSGTILQRIQEIVYGGRNLRVRVADRLPVNKTVMVQMQSNTVDALKGQSPTVVPWVSADGFTLYWLVMAIIVPRVRSDYDGQCGVTVGFTS